MMRRLLIFLAILLVFGAFAALLCRPPDISAVDFPSSDQSQNEIMPQVPYSLQGPSSQSVSTPPNVIPGFIGTSEQDKSTVTGNEIWFLDIDINRPGWLYIYEYFPGSDSSQGKWIAYKWELRQSGLWRLGPFSAVNNEPEGMVSGLGKTPIPHIAILFTGFMRKSSLLSSLAYICRRNHR
jgi:hypothetical protein